eukprot:838844_1
MSVCDLSNPLYKEWLVHGYCRECERNAQIIIPEDIKCFCCIFYGKYEDYFERIGDHIVISNDSKQIRCTGLHIYNTCYGAIEIKPSEKKIYHWVFAIQKLYDSICIGIDQSDSNWMNTWFAGRKETDHFVISNKDGYSLRHIYYDSSFDRVHAWGWSTPNINKGWISTGLEESNVVIMRLDFSDSADARAKSQGIARFGTMECCVLKNRFDTHCLAYKKIYDNIEKNRNYKMAVELRGGWGDHGSSVELLDYFENEDDITHHLQNIHQIKSLHKLNFFLG